MTSHISERHKAKFEYFVRYLGIVAMGNNEREALKSMGSSVLRCGGLSQCAGKKSPCVLRHGRASVTRQ